MLPPSRSTTAVGALVVEPAAAVPGLVFFPLAVVERADDAADLDRLAVHPIDPAADMSVEDAAGADPRRIGDGVGVVQGHDGAGGPQPENLLQQHGAVAGRAAADIVAEVDQHDRLARRLHGFPDGLLGRGAADEQPVADLPHLFAQLVGDGAGQRRIAVGHGDDRRAHRGDVRVREAGHDAHREHARPALGLAGPGHERRHRLALASPGPGG